MTEVPAPDSAEPLEAQLHRLDQQIGLLAQQAEGHRVAYHNTMAQLTAVQTQRRGLGWSLQNQAAQARATQARAAQAAQPPALPTRNPPDDALGDHPETSTRTAQNILFALGGLLLATAAIVFTAVAWATFGNGGRAAILAGVTLVALTVPLLALHRGLRATAETFAVLGLILVVLDGYAAWYVNLFGAKSVPTLSYVAIVCAATAVVAVTYRAVTSLTGPGVIAVLAAQPVLPLRAADADLTVAGWALLFALIAGLNLVLVRRGPAMPDPVLRVLGAGAHVVALVVAAVLAVAAEIVATGPQSAWNAGLALVVVALVLRTTAAVTGGAAFRAIAGAVLVVSLAIAGTRLAAFAWPSLRAVAMAATAAAVVMLAVAAARLLPPAVRPGLRSGSLAVIVAFLATVGAVVLVAAIDTLGLAVPLWTAHLDMQPRFDRQLLAAVGLATAALTAWMTTAAGRACALVAGAALATLALPGALPVAWWLPSTVDIVVAGVLAAIAVLVRSAAAVRVSAVAAAVLAGHAVLASLARPESTAAILAALAGLGIVVADLSRRGGDPPAIRATIGRVACFAGLAAVPPAVGSLLVAVDVDPTWTGRLTAASVALLVLATVALRGAWTAFAPVAYTAALVSAVVWPIVAAVATGEPVGVYTGGGLVLVAAAFAAVRLGRAGTGRASGLSVALAAVPLAILLVIDVLPALVSVFVAPFSWLAAVWSGRPAGVGLAPASAGITPAAATSDAVALGLLAVAAAVTAYALRPRLRSVLTGLGVGGPTAILTGLTAAEAPWPVVPATTLLLGLLLTTAVAVATVGVWRTTIGATQGVVYIGAGLTGALTTEWSTLAGLGVTVAAAALVGWFGATLAWRVLGWSVAVAAAVATVTAAGLAADLPLRSVAFAVIAVGALALGLDAALRATRPAEAATLHAGAHVTAVVAMAFAGTAAYAAAVGTLWGVVVAVRALAPGTGRAGRLGLAATAAAWELLAWWLLLEARDIAVVEAYTLPLAAVALLAGWAALRARPGLNSWVAYGPALAAAFLPSLATLLVLAEPLSAQAAPAWRRLLLGLGGLAVVVGGSVRRRQAPVIVGGTVLAIVALHETVLYWDVVPRWAPLALGGLLLVGIAMTYERRRRDMARLRTAIGRMT